MRKPILTTVLVSVIASFIATGAHSQGVTNEEAAANRVKLYDQTMAVLAAFKTSPQCTSATAQQLEANLDGLKEDVANYQSFATGMLRYMADEARERHTSASFAVADEALKGGCLDMADRIYRGLVTFYVGQAWAGIRDRAMLGVQDVRDARAALARAPKPSKNRTSKH